MTFSAWLVLNLLIWFGWMGCANVSFCRLFHVHGIGSKDQGSIPMWKNVLHARFFVLC